MSPSLPELHRWAVPAVGGVAVALMLYDNPARTVEDVAVTIVTGTVYHRWAPPALVSGYGWCKATGSTAYAACFGPTESV